MRGGNSCSAETFTTRRVGLRRSGVPAAILPNHSATGSRLGVAPDNSTAPVRRSGIGNCWASCESAVGRGQRQSGQDRLRRPVAARLRRPHRRYLRERTFHIAHYAKSTTSHGISDAHFSLAEHDDDRIAFRQLPRRRNRFGKWRFEPPSSGIEMRAGVSAASQIDAAIARTGRATGTPARPTTAMRKSANCYCSNLGPTGYE